MQYALPIVTPGETAIPLRMGTLYQNEIYPTISPTLARRLIWHAMGYRGASRAVVMRNCVIRARTHLAPKVSMNIGTIQHTDRLAIS